MLREMLLNDNSTVVFVKLKSYTLIVFSGQILIHPYLQYMQHGIYSNGGGLGLPTVYVT